METLTHSKKFIKESEATTRLLANVRKSFKKRFIRKIPDIGNTQKPFDVIGIRNSGIGFAREIKVIKTKKIDYESVFKKLEIHQILALNLVKQSGGEAMLVGYHQLTGSFIFYPFINEIN